MLISTNDHLIPVLLNSGSVHVSRNGDVWRKGQSKKNERWYLCRYISKDGYYRMCYRYKAIYIHRIVYSATVGPVCPWLTINHKNGIKTDNRPENLELVTIKENIHHAFSSGINDPLHSWESSFSRLTVDDVKSIRQSAIAGAYNSELALDYGVTRKTIDRVLRRETWSDVEA